jgi:LAO/AO transport system ATPase
MLASLLDRFRHRDRLALARLVSLAARGEQVEAILAGLAPPARPARVVAVTGAGGVGKSSLTGRLIEEIRKGGQTVAVLACDPESPVSGGALLGDRFRMPARPDDDGVFIRSLAAAGGQGALAAHLPAIVRVVEAFGFDVVILETVGAGQGDTAARALADVLVLLLQPETGDELQWEKAGLLEVADLVVIHKADLPGADRVEAQVLATLGLSKGPTPPVLRVSARSGAGVADLWRAAAALPLRRGQRRDADELHRLAREWLAMRYAEARTSPEVADLVRRWRDGVASDEAAEALVRLLVERRPGEPAGSSRRPDADPAPAG